MFQNRVALLVLCFFSFSFVYGQNVFDLAVNQSIEEINLSNQNLDSLPSYVCALTSLKRINLSGNKKIKVIDTFKKLAQLPMLEEINIDNCNLLFLPSIVGTFKQLKTLSIAGNGIAELPLSFKNLPLEELNLANNRLDSLNADFFSLRNLKSLNFSQNSGSSRDYNMDILATLPNLETLILQNTVDFSKKIGRLIHLKNLDLSFSEAKFIPYEFKNLQALQKLNIAHCTAFDLSLTLETLAALKNLNTLAIGHFKLEIIPFNISKLKALKTLLIYNSNLGRLPISFKEVKLHSVYFYQCKFQQENEFFNELKNNTSLKKIEVLNSTVEKEKENPFNQIIEKHLSEMPLPSYQLLTSKVFLFIKKQNNSNSFYFTLEPQYGFNEKYLAVFGDKVKAYPELKVYQKIQWNYTGTTMNDDLEKMYALSEKTDAEKAKKRSSLTIYVFHLQDVFIYPDKLEDTYIMALSRGFDTLQLKVLPALKTNEPKKIQKWHRNKFEEYNKQKTHREEKWKLLEEKYLIYFKKYEEDLERFREELIRK